MEILAIIPARGDSKGLPRKNIKIINSKPLIYYTIKASVNCPYISRTIVSTDDLEISHISQKYGADTPFLRPKELSSDISSSIDTVLHCLDYLKNSEKYIPDYVCLLQCTSPLRTEIHISDAISLLFNKNAESVASVCLADKSPYWAKTINKSGCLEDLIKNDMKWQRRQELPDIYNLNGAIYLNKTEALYNNKAFVTNNTYPYIMNKQSSVDIDDEIDFILCQSLMKETALQ